MWEVAAVQHNARARMFIRRTPKCSTRLYSKTYQVTLSLFLQSSYPPATPKVPPRKRELVAAAKVVRWFRLLWHFSSHSYPSCFIPGVRTKSHARDSLGEPREPQLAAVQLHEHQPAHAVH